MKRFFLISIFMLSSVLVFGQHQHNQHAAHQKNHHDSKLPHTPLKQTGSDVFDAIQEVIKHLKADPNTDWTKVNLESLRQHLIDMKAFTEEVEVLQQEAVEKGIRIVVKGETERAEKALGNMLKMHPKMMKMERNWEMKAEKKKDVYEIICTTENSEEIALIRGLGYIGLIVEGAHHQVHHWMMATGAGHH